MTANNFPRGWDQTREYPDRGVGAAGGVGVDAADVVKAELGGGLVALQVLMSRR